MALNIKRALEERGMSVVQLSEKMGKTHQAVYSVLKKGNPSVSYLRHIAKALGCDVTALFDKPTSALPHLKKEQDTIRNGTTLGLNVRRIAKIRNMNIKKLAFGLDMTYDSLINVLNGSPKIQTLENIASVLSCDVYDFFAGVQIEDDISVTDGSVDKHKMQETERKKEVLERKRTRQSSRIVMALNIKRALKERGVSVVQLAERIGKTNQTLYAVLNNGNPSVSYLYKIAKALNCDVTDLFDKPFSTLPPLSKEQDTIKVGSELCLNVRRIAKIRNMNLNSIASSLGMKSSTLSSALNNSPKIQTLEKIASILQCDVYDFFAGVRIEEEVSMTDGNIDSEKTQEAEHKKKLLERKRSRQSARIAANANAQRYAQRHKQQIANL